MINSKDHAWLDFDLTTVRERFRLKSPYGKYADKLELETRRFLYLSETAPFPVAPSPLVDEFWHAMILDTKVYAIYCQEAFGRLVEHVIDIPTAERGENHAKNYKDTLSYYQKIFGEPDEEIWTSPTKGVLPKRYLTPHRLHLETTNHCNLHCEHCYPASSHLIPHHEMEDLERVLAEAKRTGVGKITLTGGELLTRPDWKEVVSKALDVCDNLYFITNGVLISDKVLKWLAKEKTKRTFKKWAKTFFRGDAVEIGLAISLDGLKGNELVRKNAKGAPVKAEQTLKQIELAVKYGLHVTVNTTITNEVTAKELPAMYDILSKMGIDRWQIDQAYVAGRMLDSPLKEAGLSWLETAKPGFKYIIQNYIKDFPKLPKWRLEIVQVFRYDSLFHGFSPAASLDEHPCDYQFGSVIVEKGDEVRFCPSLRNAGIGKLSEFGTFEGAYNSNKDFSEFLNKSMNDLPCKSCRYVKLFHGGCRANSLSYNGKMWDRDPICCSLSPFVEDEIVPLMPKDLRESFFASLQAGKRPDELGHPAYGSSLSIMNNNSGGGCASTTCQKKKKCGS